MTQFEIQDFANIYFVKNMQFEDTGVFCPEYPRSTLYAYLVPSTFIYNMIYCGIYPTNIISLPPFPGRYIFYRGGMGARIFKGIDI